MRETVDRQYAGKTTYLALLTTTKAEIDETDLDPHNIVDDRFETAELARGWAETYQPGDGKVAVWAEICTEVWEPAEIPDDEYGVVLDADKRIPQVQHGWPDPKGGWHWEPPQVRDDD